MMVLLLSIDVRWFVWNRWYIFFNLAGHLNRFSYCHQCLLIPNSALLFDFECQWWLRWLLGFLSAFPSWVIGLAFGFVPIATDPPLLFSSLFFRFFNLQFSFRWITKSRWVACCLTSETGDPLIFCHSYFPYADMVHVSFFIIPCSPKKGGSFLRHPMDASQQEVHLQIGGIS